jgi:SnoaL-like protein
MTGGESPLSRFYTAIIGGDLQGLASLFADSPRIDDPLQGRAVGDNGLQAYIVRAHRWLSDRFAEVRPVASTLTRTRAVEELVLRLYHEGRDIELPLALVGDLWGDGLTAVRIYHSTWPLTGRHAIRQPILKANERLAMPDVIGRYQAALRDGWLDDILACFDPGGYAREPSGGDYVYRGPERLREFYGALLADGGITLEHCTATDDGTRCAVEYNCTAWGGKALTPQAGVAVYERAPSGLLGAARIYDDVDPPLD